MKQAMMKKKTCDAKAQQIVEKLLDPFEDESQFLLMVRYSYKIVFSLKIHSDLRFSFETSTNAIIKILRKSEPS